MTRYIYIYIYILLLCFIFVSLILVCRHRQSWGEHSTSIHRSPKYFDVVCDIKPFIVHSDHDRKHESNFRFHINSITLNRRCQNPSAIYIPCHYRKTFLCIFISSIEKHLLMYVRKDNRV